MEVEVNMLSYAHQYCARDRGEVPRGGPWGLSLGVVLGGGSPHANPGLGTFLYVRNNMCAHCRPSAART